MTVKIKDFNGFPFQLSGIIGRGDHYHYVKTFFDGVLNILDTSSCQHCVRLVLLILALL